MAVSLSQDQTHGSWGGYYTKAGKRLIPGAIRESAALRVLIACPRTFRNNQKVIFCGFLEGLQNEVFYWGFSLLVKFPSAMCCHRVFCSLTRLFLPPVISEPQQILAQFCMSFFSPPPPTPNLSQNEATLPVLSINICVAVDECFRSEK